VRSLRKRSFAPTPRNGGAIKIQIALKQRIKDALFSIALCAVFASEVLPPPLAMAEQ
jgi:hypothetical protein